MFFSILSNGIGLPAHAQSKAFLLTDNWDDWFKYNTLYSLILFDQEGVRHIIGGVKIGQFSMDEGQRRAAIPERFNELDEVFFSLGQDDSYYERLNTLGADFREKVLRGLRDVAFDRELFVRAL